MATQIFVNLPVQGCGKVAARVLIGMERHDRVLQPKANPLEACVRLSFVVRPQETLPARRKIILNAHWLK